jgi:Phosphate acetyl/butaryl transferase
MEHGGTAGGKTRPHRVGHEVRTIGTRALAPDLDAKRDIVQNTIDLFVQLGLGTPRVAILSAVETVTTKIPSTIEAAALCKMAERGQITGGVLDGPLAFDNAIDPEAAETKGIRSAVAGRAQILIVPDLEAGTRPAASAFSMKVRFLASMFDRRIGNEQLLRVVRHVHHEDMADAPGCPEAGGGCGHRPHELVGMKAALHQQLCLAFMDQLHRLGGGRLAMGDVDKLEPPDIEVMLSCDGRQRIAQVADVFGNKSCRKAKSGALWKWRPGRVERTGTATS